MTTTHPQILLLSLATLAVFLLVGRLFTAHAADRDSLRLPATCACAGLGLWLVWSIGLGTLGVSIKVLWWLFVGTWLALMFGMFKTFHHQKSVENTWVSLLLGALLMVPLLGESAMFTPSTYTDFSLLRSADYLVVKNLFPTGENILTFRLTGWFLPAGDKLYALPVSLMAGVLAPTGYVVMNLLFLLLAASAFLAALNVNVRWSNLPLVTGTGLIALTLLNPFFWQTDIFTPLPTFVLATCLLVASLPLVRPDPLPTGFAILPVALAFSPIMVLWPAGIPLFITFVLLWGVRLLVFEDEKISLRDMFALTFLITFPLLTWLLWQLAVATTGVGVPLIPRASLYVVFDGVWNFATTHPLTTLLCTAIAGLWGYSLTRLRHYQHVRALFTTYAWLTTPFLLTIGMVISLPFTYGALVLYNSGLENPLTFIFSTLQFVLLIPLWTFAKQYYDGTALQKALYHTPWASGMVLAVGAFLGLTSLGGSTVHTPTLTTMQTLRVGQEIKPLIPYGTTLATIDLYHSNSTPALAYALRSNNGVVPINAWLTDETLTRAGLHGALLANRISYLLISAPDDKIREIFSPTLQEKNAYLFEVQADQFSLIGLYPL